MSVLKTFSNDYNNDSGFNLPFEKSLYNEDDASLSYHIPLTHVHELENSTNGLNKLFNLANLNSNKASTTNKQELIPRTEPNGKNNKNEKESETNLIDPESKDPPSKQQIGGKDEYQKSKTRIKLRNFDLTQDEINALSSTKLQSKRGFEKPSENYFDEQDPTKESELPLQLSELLMSPKSKNKQNQDNKRNKKAQKPSSLSHIAADTNEVNKAQSWGVEKSSKKKKKFKKNTHTDKSSLMNKIASPLQLSDTLQVPLYYQSNIGFMPILIPNSTPNQLTNQAISYPYLDKNVHLIQSTSQTLLEDTHSKDKTTEATTQSNEPLSQSDPINQKRLDSRLKEIAVGKSTTSYRNYIKSVPKQKRTDLDPDTPNPFKNSSASTFRAICQTWRRSLHKYDAQNL